MEEEIIDLDAAPVPGGVSGLDLLKWAPIIEKFLTAIKAAIAGGPLEVPAIKVRIFGHPVTLGPIPIKIGV